MAALGLARDPPGEDIYELIKQALCHMYTHTGDEAYQFLVGSFLFNGLFLFLQLTSPGNLIKDKK